MLWKHFELLHKRPHSLGVVKAPQIPKPGIMLAKSRKRGMPCNCVLSMRRLLLSGQGVHGAKEVQPHQV